MLIKGKAFAVMSEQTAQRLGPASELIAEHAKIKGVIVLSAEDCFPDATAQEEFYTLASGQSALALREAVIDAAQYFGQNLTAIHPSLANLGGAYQELIFSHILKDQPMALPILPENDDDPINIGFIVLGRNHDSGAHLAEKLSGVDFSGYEGLPSHAELEQLVIFHELDHLRPERGVIAKHSEHNLAEETGRDAFALQVTEGMVSDHVRQTFLDSRMLGLIHTNDPDHRTSLGLTLLNDPHTDDIATWRGLNELGHDIHRATRKTNPMGDMLSSMFGNSAEMAGLTQLLSVMPLSRKDGFTAVTNYLQDQGHAISPDTSRILRGYLDSFARLEALKVAPETGFDSAPAVTRA